MYIRFKPQLIPSSQKALRYLYCSFTSFVHSVFVCYVWFIGFLDRVVFCECGPDFYFYLYVHKINLP